MIEEELDPNRPEGRQLANELLRDESPEGELLRDESPEGEPLRDELLEDKLSRYVGQAAGEPVIALDEVNQAMIRHWCEAMGDRNPIYRDENAAISNGFPGVVAPPTMLQAWGMKGLGFVDARTSDRGEAFDELMELLNANGYTSVVATNCEQIYNRYLRLGERLIVHPTIKSISDRKSTALGTGYFITTETDYKTVDGELVGSMVFRILKFRPQSSKQSM